MASTSPCWFHFPASRVLGAVLAAGTALRIAYLLELRQTPFYSRLILDLASYDSWAQRIAQGEWLGSRVFYQDPLYPYLLGAIYALFGHRLLLVYMIQIVLGILTCFLIYRIGRQQFSEAAGLAACALAAVYPPFVFYDVQVEKSSIAVLLLVAACWLVLRSGDGRSHGLVLASGVLLGLAVLLRGNYLLLVPVLAAGMTLREGASRRLTTAAVFLSGALLVLSTTLARNYVVSGDVVLTTSQAGQNFFIGNNPSNRTGMYRAPGFVRPDPKYEEADFAREAERLSGRSLRPSEVSRFWFGRALDQIMREPVEYLELLGVKTALFWNRFEIPDNLDLYFFQRYSLVLRLWLPAFGVVAPLGLAGMIMAVRQWKRLWVLYVCVGGYFLSVLPFYVFSRYRLPVVPFLMVFAGSALADGWSRLRSNPRRLLRPAVIVALAAAAVNLPLLGAYNPSALNNLGAVLLNMGDVDEAERLFRQVLDRRPDFADARNNLGVLLLRRGDVPAAVAELREAVSQAPDRPNARINLAEALAREGDHDGAGEVLRQALKLDPRSGEAYAALGALLRAKGDREGAVEGFRKAVDLDPDSAANRNNLAASLLAIGRPGEALPELEEALRRDPDSVEARFNLGVCFERLGRNTEAVRAYRQSLALRPDYAEAWNNLGNLLAAGSDRAGAREAFANFLRYWKGDAAVRREVEAELERLR